MTALEGGTDRPCRQACEAVAVTVAEVRDLVAGGPSGGDHRQAGAEEHVDR